jgi:WYL domain
VPRQHEVSVRIQAPAELIRTRLPASIATVEDIPAEPASNGGAAGGAAGGERDGGNGDGGHEDQDGWVRVQLQAERLDWVPAVLASLDRPFVIDHPKALRDQVRALARRLSIYADAD